MIDLTKRSETSTDLTWNQVDTNWTTIETYLNGLGTYVQVNIGDWDMLANASVTIAHGLSATEWKTVRQAQAVIRIDSDTIYSYDTKDIQIDFDSTNITLTRTAGTSFESANYDSTSYNRGWVTFYYTED